MMTRQNRPLRHPAEANVGLLLQRERLPRAIYSAACNAFVFFGNCHRALTPEERAAIRLEERARCCGQRASLRFAQGGLFENPLLFDKGGLRAFSREPKEEGVQNNVFDERHEIAQSPH
jgi:hypothetical protein